MALEVFKLVGRITYEGQKKVEAGLSRLEKKINNAEKALKDFGDKAQAVGEKTSAIGEGFTKNVTVPLAALGAAGIFTADQMQKSQGRIQASLGMTAEEAKELNDVAKRLWQDAFGEDVIEVGNSVATVKKNMENLNNAELEKVTAQAYTLRDLFEYEINESTRAGKALMDNFGITGSKAMDLITVGAQKGADYSDELIDTIKEYSSDFSEIGMSAEGMFNILIQGSQNGAWSLDKVGDAVKEFNIKAQDGSKATKEGFEAIGFNAEEMGQKIAAGGEEGERAFMATVTALAGMEDEYKRNQAGVALFGTQWEDLKGKVITTLDPTKDMLGEVEGATKKAGDALYDNFGTRLQSTFRTVQSALEPLGNILIDMIEPAIASLSTKVEQLVNWFGSLSAGQQKFIVILGLVAAAVGPILMVLGMFISSIGAIVGAIGAVGLAASAWILGIGLLIAALVAAYMKFAWFRNGVNAVFQFLVSIIQPILQTFVTFFKAKIAEIKRWWDVNGAMIVQAFRNVFGFIFAIIKGVLALLMPIVMGFIAGIKNIISGGLKVIMGVITFFAALFTGNWRKMGAALWSIIKGAIQLIIGIFQVGFITRIFGIIGRFIGGILGKFRSWGSSILGFIRGIMNRIVGYFKGMGDTVALKVMYAFDKVKSGIMKPVQAAADFVRRQLDKISGFFSRLKMKLPKIKLPHFRLSGKLDLVPPNLSVPKLGVDWYAKGGVFGGASVIGVGEQPGVSEAVIPLKHSVLSQIGEGIARATNGGGLGTGGQAQPAIINVMLGDKVRLVRAIIDDIDRELGRKK